MSGGFSFPIPGLDKTFVVGPPVTYDECWGQGTHNGHTKKREAAREKRRWKKIHKKQGRQ